MATWVSHAVAFLLGTATGAAGKYFADKYTDKRRKSEAVSERRRSFRAVRDLMPRLIGEMREDVTSSENRTLRELVVLPNRQVLFTSGGQRRFTYYEDEHEDLRDKVTMLENLGYLLDVTPGNTPIYRMNEHFVELLLQ